MSKRRVKISQPLGVFSALACLLIATVRGGNPVAIKIVLRALSPMQAAFTRVAIGCVSVGLLAPLLGENLKPKRSELGILGLLSVLYALQIAANQTGTDFTSPVFAAILFNTYPIAANLLSSFVVREDRLTAKRLLGLAMAFCGVAWVFSARTESFLAPDPLLGNTLVLLGSGVLAVRMVYIRQLTLRIDYVKAVFWPLLGSLPLYVLGGAVLPDAGGRPEADWTIWSALLFQGVIVGGAGQLAWVYLMRRHTPGTVIGFSFLTPISGLALSSIYFHEPVPARLLTGFCAVLVGIALAASRLQPRTQPDKPGPPRGFGGSA